MVFKTPKDISRPPLITPSASPPPHASSSKTNSASPSKRQRLSSVSRSSSLQRASESVLDIQTEREASRTRLLDTWSQLAERYSRPLDEDDIVDIRTGEIVKDNGFWRATRRFGFGEVLAPEYQEETAKKESGDEDGVDELDAFTEEHDYLEDVFLARGLQKPSPVSSNAEYEDDLREFLEAEERRKEEYGSELEEEVIETSDVVKKGWSLHYPSMTHDLHEDNGDEDEESEGEEDEAGTVQDPPCTSSPVCSEYSESDDELDNWEPTEASLVAIARNHVSETLSVDDYSDSESEVEIVSVTKFLPDKQPIQAIQLHTPPHSYSSADRSITGIPLPHPPSTPTRPSNPPCARRGRIDSSFPQKPQIYHSKPRSLTSSRRVKTPPDVLNLLRDSPG